MSINKSKRIIITGGGTGGHIFPAIAIANALRVLQPNTEILFVGALGRMEMEMVPKAGYDIVGLEIRGFDRSSMVKNFSLPFKMLGAVLKAIKIINKFNPDAVVGVGGYASGPMLYAAKLKNIPYLLQEQNSFAGMTNKWLGKTAERICVAFDGMEVFFPKEKIVKTGNPIRKNVVEDLDVKKKEGLAHFELTNGVKKTILITGGSLGAKTLNQAVLKHWDMLQKGDVQLIWQTGKLYHEGIMTELEGKIPKHIKIVPFLDRMDLAYAVAHLIVARAGAGTIAELCVVQKPSILVPSPNVAEDHQTKNALALVQKNAAVMLADAEAVDNLVPRALQLLGDEPRCTNISQNMKSMAVSNADEMIAKEVFRIAKIC